MGLQNRVAEVLEKKGITRYRAAADAGIDRATIYRICGSPDVPVAWGTLEKLCEALKCQPGELLVYLD